MTAFISASGKAKLQGQKRDKCSQELRETGADCSPAGELSGPMEMLCILSVVVTTRLCTLAKTHCTVRQKGRILMSGNYSLKSDIIILEIVDLSISIRGCC